MDQQNTTNNSNNKLFITIAGLAIVGIASFALYKNSATPETVTQINNGAMGSDSIKKENVTMKYKNGTYKETGSYTSPAGPEQIDVSLTLKDDVVSDATVEPKATAPASVKFQGQFVSGFKEFVVGKKLDEINLDKVSGSSLTPKGFNEALSKIKTDAQS